MRKHFSSCRFNQYFQRGAPSWVLFILLGFQIASCVRPAQSFSPSLTQVTTRSRLGGDDGVINRRVGVPTTGTVLSFYYDSSLTDCVGSMYAYCLDQYYLPTQAATGAVCATLGDVIAQWTELQEDETSKRQSQDLADVSWASSTATATSSLEYDPVRTFHYFLKGIGGGIMWAYWFDMSEPLSNSLTQSVLTTLHFEPMATVFPGESPVFPAIPERVTHTVISILLEQFLVSPVLFTFWDIPLPALLRGTPLRQLPSQIQSKLGPLLVANAKVWTIVNVVTYNIPVEYRVLFASCADIVWQSINAGITSQEVAPTAGSIPLPAPPMVLSSVEDDSLIGVPAGPPRRSVTSQGMTRSRALESLSIAKEEPA